MIHSMMVEGLLSAFCKSRDGTADLSRIQFLREFGAKWQRQELIANSPVTGAPIAVRTCSVTDGLEGNATVRFDYPVSSALAGHSCLHGWTECLHHEKAAASLLLRVLLEQQGVAENEASGFLLSAQASSVKLIWHVDMKSRVAAKALLLRSLEQTRVLRDHNSWPDIGIKDYAFVDEPTQCRLQLELKTGNGLTLSVQPEKLPVGTDLHGARGVSADEVRAVTKSHIRVEASIGKRLIDGMGLGNPGSWSEYGLEFCVDTILRQSGFMSPYLPNPADLSVSGLPKDVQQIHALYIRDAALPNTDKKTIHRPRTILLASGVDLAIEPGDHRFLDGSSGRHLHYKNRWVVPEDMRKLMVSEQMAPKLTAVLSRQLNHVRTSHPV